MAERDTKREPTIWMNVSTSVNWNRPPVGIVRVEQQLFQVLKARLGERLQACILSGGKFVRYEAPADDSDAALALSAEEAFVWPDPSFDFPATASLEPVAVRRPPPSRPRHVTARREPPAADLRAGDTLLSVGLDWDWETHRLDRLMAELKDRRGVNVITCCYDLIPILFPQYCVGDVAARFQEYFTNLTWSSSGMLCISRQTQADYRELVHDLGMPEIPTTVMLLGNKLPEGGDDLSDQVRELAGQRFLLFVSTIERRKNHEVVYKALHLLAERKQLDPDLKLVFVGMPGWGVGDLIKDIELDPLTDGHIVQIHHANDAELRRLYETCEFFVYPSLYEGWGLPVAEALALGKFVLASDRGSIPEIAGSLVEYVDPWNATAWADAILRYWNDPALLAERTGQVVDTYRPISWDDAADAVLALVEEVERERPRALVFAPGYDMFASDGLRFGAKIVSSGERGVICHGPYVPLPAGDAVIEVVLEVPGGALLDLTFKFAVLAGEKVLKRVSRQLASGDTRHELSFPITLHESVEDFELVIEDHRGEIFSLESLTIRPV